MLLSRDTNLGNRDELSFPSVPHHDASEIQKRQAPPSLGRVGRVVTACGTSGCAASPDLLKCR